MAPQEVRSSPGPGPHRDLEVIVDTIKDSAPYPHPSTEDRPCACLNGTVFISYEDEYGEEREASYPCRRCSETS
jgi:hypothetical protein